MISDAHDEYLSIAELGGAAVLYSRLPSPGSVPGDNSRKQSSPLYDFETRRPDSDKANGMDPAKSSCVVMRIFGCFINVSMEEVHRSAYIA